VAVLGGGALGASALVASLTSAVPAELAGGAIPEAFAAGGDGGSTYVSQAQRGEVSPPEVEDVEQMCALLTSCKGLPLPPSLIPHDFGDCMRKMAGDMTQASAVLYSLTIRECGLTATSCEALRNCVLRGASKDACNGRAVPQPGQPPPDPVGLCVADDKTGRDLAVTCFNGNVLSVRDCTRGNETCQVYTPKDCGKDGCSAQSRCVLGPCTPETKSSSDWQCSKSGTHLIRCTSGKLESLDCAAFGLKCTTDDNGKPTCATSTKECKTGSKHCDGDTAVGCFHGHEVRVDCKKVSLTCSTSSTATVGDCAAASDKGACDAKDGAKCGGAKNDKISYCYAGKTRNYDCSTFFGKCDAKGGVHCTGR
jgi:hypothetical protein